MSDVVRIDSLISYHLSKVSKTKFSLLYDIFVLPKLKEKIELDHS